ncbi:MAG: DUF302 domain-containing protein [Pseudomonadota bacterium]
MLTRPHHAAPLFSLALAALVAVAAIGAFGAGLRAQTNAAAEAGAGAETGPTETDLIALASPHSAKVTMDRLVAAVEKAGAKVFARIDHAAGAASIGETLEPTQLLVFGNPKIGTAPIQANRTIGLDLPLRVLVFEQDGETLVIYQDPYALAELYDLPVDHPNIVTMANALGKLTDAATAE